MFFFYTHMDKNKHKCMILCWKVFSSRGVSWEHDANWSPPTYGSPTDQWENSALSQSILWEPSWEKKASERTCKVEHGVLTWWLTSPSTQPCWGLSLNPVLERLHLIHLPGSPANPLWAEVCLLHLWTPALLAFSPPWPYRPAGIQMWTCKSTRIRYPLQEWQLCLLLIPC